jgi:hypothetical protein
MIKLKEITPPKYLVSMRAVTALQWMTKDTDFVESLVYGTSFGYLVIWRQNDTNAFIEYAARCLASYEILSIASDTSAGRHDRRLAVILTNETIHLLQFNCDSLRVFSYDFRPTFLSFLSGASFNNLRAFTFHGKTLHTIDTDTGKILKSVGVHQQV